MSNTIATDILEYENMLREAGVPDKHAMAHARCTAKIMENNLATKQDLEAVRADLKKDIAWIMIGGAILGTIIIAGLGLIIWR